MKLSNFSSKMSRNRDYGFNAKFIKNKCHENCEKFFKITDFIF